MRWLAWVFSILFTLVLIGGAAAGYWGLKHYRGPGPAIQDKIFIVARGQGVGLIAENLERENLIHHALLFRAVAQLSKADKNIHAGEYAIPAHASMDFILGMMTRGDVVKRKITVREGLTSWQVMRLVAAAEGLEGDVPPVPAEGSLLPETYHYLLGDTRLSIVAQMEDSMARTLAELWPQRDDNIPLKTPEEAVILAAIVEKETAVPAERARVAGVFINRLRMGMPLQSDPTVIYAMTEGEMQDEGKGPLGRRLLSADLRYDSPYNTYRYPGLPPGPIANPGRAALEAVLHPEEHDYLYFVADGAGGHAFARNLAEHNANVAKWRAHRRKNGP